MASGLGSRTSGVDGSSEGGRINTLNLPGALMLYAVPLMQGLKRRGYQGKLSAAPLQVDGVWCLELTYEGDQPKDAPALWHGHRVVLKQAAPPPSA